MLYFLENLKFSVVGYWIFVAQEQGLNIILSCISSLKVEGFIPGHCRNSNSRIHCNSQKRSTQANFEKKDLLNTLFVWCKKPV